MFAPESSKMLFNSTMFIGLVLMAAVFNLLVILAYAEGEVRLVNGANNFEGLVEVSKDGQWGTICDDGWDIADAHVVCRQLGLGYAVSANVEGSFERGSGPIAMDEVSCVGDEERLDQCSFRGWFLHDCVHQEDVVIRCSTEDGGLRLVGGTSLYEGRIEIFQNSEWGTICDDGWDDNDATVVCRALDFGYPAQAFGSAHYGEGTGKILLSNIECDGTERSLDECDQKAGLVSNCEHSEDAGVKCNEPYTPNDICTNYDVRIVDGATESDGIVEVCYKDHWGTVCASSWKGEEALVVCRQLGYTVLDTFYSRTSTTSVSDQIVENLSCTHNHFSLSNCDVTFGNPVNCTFNAGLSCSREVECIDGQVQLDEGNSRSSGRVQVCKTGQWVILCGTSWGYDEARVVCRQLGYSTVRSYDSVSINTFAVDVSSIQSASCEGTESSLSYCSLITRPSCSRQATVTCTSYPSSNDSGSQTDGGGSRFPLIEALSGGFGTFVGIVILICTCWCCCCTGETE